MKYNSLLKMTEVIKMLIRQNVSQILLEKSKEIYRGIISIHENCEEKSKFYTKLYPIMYLHLAQTPRAVMGTINVENTKNAIIHHGMHASDSAFDHVIAVIKKTPSNRLCFIMLTVDYVILIYCPVIDSDADKENLSLDIHTISKGGDLFCKTFTVNYKDKSYTKNKICLYCYAQITSEVLCGICNLVVYCSQSCLSHDKNNHKIVCKNYNENHFINKLCASCGQYNVKAKRCSACERVRYCDKACQKKDWKNHKIICKSIK